VTLHRLNNIEFDLTVQDLLLTELALSSTLPPNGSLFGFDNNAEAQKLGVLHVETIESALDAVIADGLRAPIVSETTLHQPEDPSWSGNGLAPPKYTCGMGPTYPYDPCIALWHSSAHGANIKVDHTGPYTLRMSVCQEYNTAFPSLEFAVDNVVKASFVITADCKNPEEVTATIDLEEGLRDILLIKHDQEGTKVVRIDWVELTGPLDADGKLPPGRAKLYQCDPEPAGKPDVACARVIIKRFMDEAWRRPVTDVEVGKVMAFMPPPNPDPNAPPVGSIDIHTAIQYAVKRTMWSPWFLFRVEVPDSPDTTSPQRLSAHELATRLSYFLWSTQPDAALREAADDGSLLEDDILEAQARRMLLDPKSEALVDGFGGQWLGLTQLAEATPDMDIYPLFDEPLREAMAAEIRDLSRRVLLGDGSMLDIFTADSRWIEPRLAQHYGLDVTEAGYHSVPGRSHSGLLTTAGILTATSNATRTSPVRRGHWIVSHLLCEEPPPPPDGVEQDLDKPGELAGTPREQLAEHRKNPMCASCHDQLDPVGLALEGFDGIGLLRTKYPDGSPIDVAGDLVGVGPFANVSELAAALAEQPRASRCMVQKAFTYALGRGLRGEDWPFMAPIEESFVASGHRFADLVVGVVSSELFRSHRGGS
jgi:hypothetical protein